MTTMQALQERIRDAAAQGQRLRIRGHGSKDFYGGDLAGEVLDMSGFAGVSAYEPSELYITAKAGTPIAEVEALLAEHGQCLPFEPPRFGGLGTPNGTPNGAPNGTLNGTIGGMVASGLSGPTRATLGSVRDHVLGLTLINGRAEAMNFGGTVIKNVAGYDVSRLVAGSMGVLGLIAEVSLKVLPRPVAQATLRFDMSQAQALTQLNRWGGQPLPLNASAWWDGALVLRLAGAQAAVESAIQSLGGDVIPQDMAQPFWTGLRDHEDEFFQGATRAVQGGARLWRVSVPSTAPALELRGEQLIEWGGAQRWVVTPLAATQLREMAAGAGGHATLFRSLDKSPGAFAPLSAPLMRIHRELKKAFDPAGIFNFGRLYPEL